MLPGGRDSHGERYCGPTSAPACLRPAVPATTLASCDGTGREGTGQDGAALFSTLGSAQRSARCDGLSHGLLFKPVLPPQRHHQPSSYAEALGKRFPALPSGTAALYGSTALCRWGAGSGPRALQWLWLSSGTGVGSGSDREGLCPSRCVCAPRRQRKSSSGAFARPSGSLSTSEGASGPAPHRASSGGDGDGRRAGAGAAAPSLSSYPAPIPRGFISRVRAG